MRGDAVHLGHEHADPDGTLGDLDVEELLDGERERQLGEKRRGVVHARHVGGTLQVGEVLAGALHAGVQVADDGLASQHGLALEFEHEPEHTMGARMLRAHVDDHGLIVGGLVEFVLERLGLGQSQHGAEFAEAFGRGDDVAALEFLCTFGGLGEVHGGFVGRGHGGYRFAGAPLNCTGMRPES